jgi:hypothetical protein
LRKNGWNDRLQLLASDVECTSDQESNPDGAGFLIMFKRARNPHVTDFLRYIDHARLNNRPLFRRQRSHTRKEEPRFPHPDQQESRISERLPQSCPLDWFDPDYFNNMDVEFRALYIDAPIALPLPADCGPLTDMVARPPDWKNMPEPMFMDTYGNAVRAQYNLPTEEELNILNGIDRDEDPDHMYQDGNNNGEVQLGDREMQHLDDEDDRDLQLLNQFQMPPPTEFMQPLDQFQMPPPTEFEHLQMPLPTELDQMTD